MSETAAPLQMPYFPTGYIQGTCLACQRGHHINGCPICPACLAVVKAIIEPSRRKQRQVLEQIAGQTSVELLRIARTNATGDWRRAALSRRLAQLGVEY